MQTRFSLILSISLLVWTNTVAQSFSDYVNPFVGTDFNGHTFPGATVPFGMVQLSPDTRIDGSWEGCSGYHYSDNKIFGFSHTHLSGTGVSDYGDILIMPQLGRGSFENSVYATSFSHDNEWARPGYYSVRLENNIVAELTASQRVGMHKYTFPAKSYSVVIDLQHRDKLLNGGFELINDSTLKISRVSSAWAQNQHCYAYLESSLPFKIEFNSDSTKALLRYNAESEVLLLKVGVSFTSTLGAQRNLKNEVNHWDFEKVRDEAKMTWDLELGKIEVEDNEEKLKTFYTALYHTMIHPNIATDVNGMYRGMDNKIHKAEGFNYYTVFSLWDTFRATHPLYTIIDRKRTRDFLHTFVKMYEQSGRLPVWELCSNETNCMIGYHSVSVIADALSKGIDDFDIEIAFEAMKRSATVDMFGMNAFMNNGFLFIEDEHESVSKTLEYAYDDWCIAQVAHYLNKPDDYRNFTLSSNAWKNLLDPDTKLMRPRRNSGWLEPFDPKEVNNHFTEANAWQYSFFVPHDVDGLISAMGGSKNFENQMDQLFAESSKTSGRNQVDITGLIGQYAHGNEPSHHIAYLYNHVGKPAKTKKIVHAILEDFYTSEPDGLIGNEDCGQMSAWYVMSALGIYSICPGNPTYSLVEPYLANYTVNLENGKTFSHDKIISQLKTSNFVSHQELTGLGNDKWSLNPPPVAYVKSPVIYASNITFDDSLVIDISVEDGAQLAYQILDKEKGDVYLPEQTTTLFTIYENTSIRTYTKKVVDGALTYSRPIYTSFYRAPHPEWEIEITSKYNPQYSAGGPRALIDGVNGDENWRKGYWQGYQGQNFEATIDMGAVQTIKDLKAHFLQDTRSWILFPKSVSFSGSQDGQNFTLIKVIENPVAADDYTAQVQSLKVTLENPQSYRFIKIEALNFGKLPEWHLGAGNDAFIFIDEIIIN